MPWNSSLTDGAEGFSIHSIHIDSIIILIAAVFFFEPISLCNFAMISSVLSESLMYSRN